MFVEELHLEITRNCTLHCEHCLRGDKECVNMSLDTLDNVFKDIKGVDTLLLTGGEPLIAINQLEKLVELIKGKGIKVGIIRLITNGTIMSARVLRVLKELSEVAKLDIKVSADIFHFLELKRLGFTELRNKNFSILSECLGAIEYGAEDRENSFGLKIQQIIEAKGRAKTITPERLAEINKLVKYPYVTDENMKYLRNKGRPVFLMDDTIGGQVSIDVYGNMVNYGLEFKEEDNVANEIKVNLNNMSIKEGAEKYIEYKEAHLTDGENKLRKLVNG